MHAAQQLPSIAPRPCSLLPGLVCAASLVRSGRARAGLPETANPTGSAPLLYVHIPRCRHDCVACDCRDQKRRSPRAVEDYLVRLYQDLAHWGAWYGRGAPIRHMHWSSGAMSLLDAGTQTELQHRIAVQFPLADADERCYIVDSDPRALDADRIALARGLGFNQLGLDVGAVQAADHGLPILRPGIRGERLQQLVQTARHYGFRSVRLDLVYGHPRYTDSHLAATLDVTLDCRPERISCNYYRSVRVSCEPTLWTLPVEDQRQREYIRSRLGTAGYTLVTRCATDHFIRADEVQGAMLSGAPENVIALGASTCSRINGTLYSAPSIIPATTRSGH